MKKHELKKALKEVAVEISRFPNCQKDSEDERLSRFFDTIELLKRACDLKIDSDDVSIRSEMLRSGLVPPQRPTEPHGSRTYLVNAGCGRVYAISEFWGYDKPSDNGYLMASVDWEKTDKICGPEKVKLINWGIVGWVLTRILDQSRIEGIEFKIQSHQSN